MPEKNSDNKQFYPFDQNKPILDYPISLDHTRMMQYITCFKERYPFLQVQNIGTSVLGKNIPLLSLGEGDKCVFYIGAQNGMDWITSIILLRFVNEYAEYYRTGRRLYGLYLPYSFHQRRIFVLPMLNPDGVDYVLHGITADNPLYERLVKMNGGNMDFSHWQANGRGVDLKHNFDSGFEEYRAHANSIGITQGCSAGFGGESAESEVEAAYLGRYIRYLQPQLHAIVSLETKGEKISYAADNVIYPRTLALARILSRLTSYALLPPKESERSAGCVDWATQKLQIPAFTVSCGRGQRPLPQEEYFCIYASLREMLFQVPQLI